MERLLHRVLFVCFRAHLRFHSIVSSTIYKGHFECSYWDLPYDCRTFRLFTSAFRELKTPCKIKHASVMISLQCKMRASQNHIPVVVSLVVCPLDDRLEFPRLYAPRYVFVCVSSVCDNLLPFTTYHRPCLHTTLKPNVVP